MRYKHVGPGLLKNKKDNLLLSSFELDASQATIAHRVSSNRVCGVRLHGSASFQCGGNRIYE